MSLHHKVNDVDSIWQSFRLDPRDPQHAALRASDADRALVSSVLADAYADGRLTAVEYDERESANLAARTLGELPPLLADLVTATGQRPSALVERTPGELRREAVRDQVREVVSVAVASSSLFFICVVVWLFTGDGLDDFWPKWALIPTVLATVPVILGSKGKVDTRARRLERRQARRLAPPSIPPSAPPSPPPSPPSPPEAE